MKYSPIFAVGEFK